VLHVAAHLRVARIANLVKRPAVALDYADGFADNELWPTVTVSFFVSFSSVLAESRTEIFDEPLERFSLKIKLKVETPALQRA
jgi:hypothetical protein